MKCNIIGTDVISIITWDSIEDNVAKLLNECWKSKNNSNHILKKARLKECDVTTFVTVCPIFTIEVTE